MMASQPQTAPCPASVNVRLSIVFVIVVEQLTHSTDLQKTEREYESGANKDRLIITL